jgi:hypothetical protein
MSPATPKETFMLSMPISANFANMGHVSRGVTVKKRIAKPAQTHSATTANTRGEYSRAKADKAILLANAIMYVVRKTRLFHLS